MALRNIYNMTRQQYCVDSLDANSSLQLDEVDIASGGGAGSQNLASVLSLGSDAENNNISNVNNLSVNNYLICGQTEGSQIHMNTSEGTNFQIVGTSGDALVIQEYNNNSLTNEQLQIQGSTVNVGDLYSSNPVVSVLGSRGLGRVYDNLYNVPSGSGGSSVISHLSLITDITETVFIGQAIAKGFNQVDTANGVGSVPISNSNGHSQFMNNGTSEILVLIHGFMIWSPAYDPTSSRSVYFRKNGSDTDIYSQVVVPAGTLTCTTATSCVMLLQPNDYFEFMMYHNDSVVAQIPNLTGNTPGCKLTITRLL